MAKDRLREFEKGFNPGGHGRVCDPVVQIYKARSETEGPSRYEWNAQRSPRRDDLYKIKYSRNGQCHNGDGPAIVVWDKAFVSMEYWYQGKCYARFKMDAGTGAFQETYGYRGASTGKARFLLSMGKDSLFTEGEGKAFLDAVSKAKGAWSAWTADQLPDAEIASANQLRQAANEKIRRRNYAAPAAAPEAQEAGDVPLPRNEEKLFERPPRVSRQKRGSGQNMGFNF